MSVTGVVLIVLVLVALVFDVASEAWLRRSPKEQDRQSAVAEKRVPGSREVRDKPLAARRPERPVLLALESAEVSPEVAGKQKDHPLTGRPESRP